MPRQWYKKEGEEKASDLVVPIVLLAGISFCMMFLTGLIASGSFDIFRILENASTYLSLLLGCVAACIYCGIRYFKLHGKHPVMVAAEGIRAVAGATSALLFAWVLIDMISALEAGTFLSGLIVKYAVPAVFLPFLLFLLSGVMALATGFSWGVFGIMLPISVQITQSLNMPTEMIYSLSGRGAVRISFWGSLFPNFRYNHPIECRRSMPACGSCCFTDAVRNFFRRNCGIRFFGGGFDGKSRPCICCPDFSISFIGNTIPDFCNEKKQCKENRIQEGEQFRAYNDGRLSKSV